VEKMGRTPPAFVISAIKQALCRIAAGSLIDGAVPRVLPEKWLPK
jgi:hypothetical protein